MFWFFGEACGVLAPWPAVEPAPEGKVFSSGRPEQSLLELLNEAIRPVSLLLRFTGQSKSWSQLSFKRREKRLCLLGREVAESPWRKPVQWEMLMPAFGETVYPAA